MQQFVLSISTAAVLAVLAWPVHAAERICEGELEQMQDHDNIGDCVIMYNTRAFMQVRHFCTVGDIPHCKFIGHAARTIKEPDGGISYYIDRITPQAE
jgi:hypothetical protein